MKLLISGIFFDWYSVKVKTETFSRYATTAGYMTEIVKVRNPIFFHRTKSEHRNRARLKAMQQAKWHSGFWTTVSIDDWE